MSHILFSGQEQELQAFISSKNYEAIYILVDSKTNGFSLQKIKTTIPYFQNNYTIIIPDGEANKSIEMVSFIWEEMLSKSISRNSLLINLGGGVLTDMGGFAASTYKRGIDFLNIPTTLLAMVDASTGGKTGINFNGIKNCIGAFQEPIATYINPIFLSTLSERHILNGAVEMLKHSLLHSQNMWNDIMKFSMEDFMSIDAIINSVAIKKSIVEQDLFDNGIRQSLNIGHTIGHAIESFSYQTTTPLLHGEAVLLGLIHEQIIAEQMLQCSSSIRKDLIEIKNNLFPADNFNYTLANILPFMMQDKKNTQSINMSLLKSVGQCELKVSVSIGELEKSFLQL